MNNSYLKIALTMCNMGKYLIETHNIITKFNIDKFYLQNVY